MKPLFPEAEVFTRAVEEVITPADLAVKLKSGKQLRIKFGVDITAPTLHIGNAVNLWKMRELQGYGHKVVFLIGDFTTKIGDPTGREETRRKLAARDIDAWSKNFIKQIGKVLLTDKKLFEVRKNSEWFSKMSGTELLELFNLFTHAKVIERDMFQRRIREGKEIRLPELFYPILQGYDSVMLKSDLTIIGSDQLFNENMGRLLQEKFGQRPQVVITTTITPGLDGGAKMSKSLGNHIGLDDSPTDKFGKAMRLRDELIIPYLEAYTSVPMAEIRSWEKDLAEGKNPMEAKLFFAEALVRRHHGGKEARKERERFLALFSKKDRDGAAPILLAPGEYHLLDLLVKILFSLSRSDARRLIEQRAVEINGKVIETIGHITISKGDVIRVGKKTFVKIK